MDSDSNNFKITVIERSYSFTQYPGFTTMTSWKVTFRCCKSSAGSVFEIEKEKVENGNITWIENLDLDEFAVEAYKVLVDCTDDSETVNNLFSIIGMFIAECFELDNRAYNNERKLVEDF